MDKKVLFLSPSLDLSGGNLVTLSRIRDHLKSHGYCCELSAPNAFPDKATFLHKIKEENVQLLMGIHAHKTGIFMKDSGLPYIIIIGGTDVHVFANDPKKLDEMSQAVRKARFVVCFSPELMMKVKQLWPKLDNWRLKVIAQGIEIHLPNEIATSENDIIRNCLLEVFEEKDEKLPLALNGDGVNPIIFALVCGIRPVKNPVYLVSAFQEWHARDERIFLLVLGPVLDQMYTENCFLPAIHSKPGVLFIPGVSLSVAHSIVQQSFALINSSDDEGMCLAILEAMKLGVPVLARDNVGNRTIVDDGNTGLVFTSPQTFVLKAEWLITHPKERQKIVCNAKQFVSNNHGLDFEREAYIEMVKQCLAESLADDAAFLKNTMKSTNDKSCNHSSHNATSETVLNCGTGN